MVARIRLREGLLTVVSLLALVLAVCAASARACSIDGTPSLSVDGALADLAATGPSAQDRATWAPFVLPAASPGTLLHVREDLGNLPRSLPPAALLVSFRWDFGDGATALGTAAAHRYASIGTYRLAVSYRDPRVARWITFDSAMIGIVPPGDLFRANLPATIHRYAQDALRLALWAAVCALIVWVGAPPLRRMRHPVG